jgi:hypothetical protein
MGDVGLHEVEVAFIRALDAVNRYVKLQDALKGALKEVYPF